jgi:TolA-binding protein
MNTTSARDVNPLTKIPCLLSAGRDGWRMGTSPHDGQTKRTHGLCLWGSRKDRKMKMEPHGHTGTSAEARLSHSSTGFSPWSALRRRMRKSLGKYLAAGILAFLCLNGAFGGDVNKKEEDAFYVAVKSYEDGFYDVSLTLFDRFLKTYLDSDKKLEALLYIGQCYYAQEKYLKALEQFESLLKIEGVDHIKDKVYFWLGEVYAKGRDYKQAGQYYKELIDNYKDSPFLLSAYKSLAQAEVNEGNFSQAIETYRQILLHFKDSSVAEEASFGLCESLYRLRDYSVLIKELNNFISQYPHSALLARVYFYLGEADFYMGQYNEAIDSYDHAQKFSQDVEQGTLAQLGEGWAYLKLKKFQEAQGIFSKFEEEGAPLGVILGKAVLESGLGEYEKSLALFEKVIDTDKEEEYAPFAYFGKAEAFYNLSHFDEAIIAYRIALDKLKAASRTYGEARELKDKILYGLAWAYLKVGDFRSAQDIFQKVVSFSSDKIFQQSALCQLGDTYQDTGEYKKAIETYQKFIQDYPESIYNDYIQYQLGMTWLKMENLDSAILAFRKLLKDYPSSKLVDDAHYFVGVSYFQKGDFSAARQQLESFVKSFKDSPYRPQAIFLLGESLANLSDYKAAIDIFDAVIKEFFSQETLRQKAEYEIANAYAQMGNDAEADKRLSDFITRYPDSQLSPNIIFWLGQSYASKKDYALARKYFERLVRNYPDHEFIADAYLEIGFTYLNEANPEMALRNFEQAKEDGKKETKGKALLAMGDLYLAKEGLQEALKNYEEAAHLGGEIEPVAYIKMAQVYQKSKAYPEAKAILKKVFVLEDAEKNSEVQFSLAEILEETGMTEEAIEAYMRVYYLHPEDTDRSLKALLRVAKIYETKERWPEFKSILEKVATYSAAPEAKYAKERLSWLKENRLVK